MIVFLDVDENDVLLNHTFTRSEDVSILGGFVTVSVTLNQLENAIGVQVRAALHVVFTALVHDVLKDIGSIEDVGQPKLGVA